MVAAGRLQGDEGLLEGVVVVADVEAGLSMERGSQQGGRRFTGAEGYGGWQQRGHQVGSGVRVVAEEREAGDRSMENRKYRNSVAHRPGCATECCFFVAH